MDARYTAARMRSHRTSHSDRRSPTLVRAGLLVILSLSVIGCRSGMNTDLLERELRMQEDRIYEMEDHLEDCHAVTETYRQENAKLQRRLDQRKNASSKSSRSETHRDSDLDLPDIQEESYSDTDLFPPVIEEENGQPDDESTPSEPTLSPEVELTVPIEEPEAVTARPISSGLEELPLPVGRQPANTGLLSDGVPLTETGLVDRIVLHRVIGPTRPPTPEGLVLQAVIEPRDTKGRPIRTEGNVSLMVIDPRQSGAARHLGRWNFSGKDADSKWLRTGLGSGLHVEVFIPADLPDDAYELWARLVTPEGVKHLTNVEFDLDRQAMMGQLHQTRPHTQSVVTVRSQAEEPIPVRRRAKATPLQAMSGPLTEAPRWSSSEVATKLDPPDASSPPPRQASRLQWSPYR